MTTKQTTARRLMTAAYREAIYSKYKIIEHLEFKQFDYDWKYLESCLTKIKKTSFEPNERIIIEHHDCDYYCSDLKIGLGLRNLFTAFATVDIPYFTMLLFTNHFGISEEIDHLAPDPNDRPTVIETFITRTHYSSCFDPIDINLNQLQKPAVCMMSQGRSHRHALFNFLQNENLLSNVAVSYRGTT